VALALKNMHDAVTILATVSMELNDLDFMQLLRNNPGFALMLSTSPHGPRFAAHARFKKLATEAEQSEKIELSIFRAGGLCVVLALRHMRDMVDVVADVSTALNDLDFMQLMRNDPGFARMTSTSLYGPRVAAHTRFKKVATEAEQVDCVARIVRIVNSESAVTAVLP